MPDVLDESSEWGRGFTQSFKQMDFVHRQAVFLHDIESDLQSHKKNSKVWCLTSIQSRLTLFCETTQPADVAFVASPFLCDGTRSLSVSVFATPWRQDGTQLRDIQDCHGHGQQVHVVHVSDD